MNDPQIHIHEAFRELITAQTLLNDGTKPLPEKSIEELQKIEELIDQMRDTSSIKFSIWINNR